LRYYLFLVRLEGRESLQILNWVRGFLVSFTPHIKSLSTYCPKAMNLINGGEAGIRKDRFMQLVAKQ
jgi:hypothetical protein